MPRFVILSHDWPYAHYDLMLESGNALRTWRLSEPPEEEPVAAEPLADHRLDFLEYEGPLSGERGSVTRWDSGTFEWECDTGDLIRIRAKGIRVAGDLELQKVPRDSAPPFPLRIGAERGGLSRGETETPSFVSAGDLWICRLLADPKN